MIVAFLCQSLLSYSTVVLLLEYFVIINLIVIVSLIKFKLIINLLYYLTAVFNFSNYQFTAVEEEPIKHPNILQLKLNP